MGSIEIVHQQMVAELRAGGLTASTATSMFDKCREHMLNPQSTDAGDHRRLGSFFPYFFSTVIVGTKDAQWAAAYAISALRDLPNFPTPEIPERTDEMEAKVLVGVESFLKERSETTCSKLVFTGFKEKNSILTVEGISTVSQTLPFLIAGTYPKLAAYEGLPDRPALQVEINDRKGTMEKKFKAKAIANDDWKDSPTGEIASCRFSFSTASTPNNVFAVSHVLNNRRIVIFNFDTKDISPDTVILRVR